MRNFSRRFIDKLRNVFFPSGKQKDLLCSALLLAALSLSFVSQTFGAAVEICGNGIDDVAATGGTPNGTLGSCPAGYMDAVIGTGCDAKCATPDEDNDGYTSDGSLSSQGSTAIDCDDHNKKIYPGISIATGCSGTNVRLCQTDGTYGSCGAFSCTKFVDCGNSTGLASDSNNGNTYTTPYLTLGKVSGGGGTGLPASPYTLVADDTVCMIGTGVCNTTFTSGTGSTSTIFETVSDGTAGHTIALKRYPGSTATISNSNGFGFVIRGDYFLLEGVEGATARTSANNASFVYGLATTGVEIRNIYIASMSGMGNNNDSGIYFNGNHDTNFHHNFLHNIKAASGTDVNNIWGITWLDETATANCANHVGKYNTFWNDTFDDTLYGGGLRAKHGCTDAETGVNGHRIEFNSFTLPGQEAISWSSAGLRAYGNRFSLDVTGYAFVFSQVNGVRHENNQIKYNTMLSGLGLVSWNFPYYSAPESLYIDHNVAVASTTSFAAGNHEGLVDIDGYGSDAQKTTVDGGMLTCDYNCWYSPNATANFAYFSMNSGAGGHGPAGNAGSNYTFSGGTSWQTTLGQDTHGFLENPGLNAKGEATSTNCTTVPKGANNAIYSSSTTTTLAPVRPGFLPSLLGQAETEVEDVCG